MQEFQEQRSYPEVERRVHPMTYECQKRFDNIKLDIKEDLSEMKEAIKSLAAGMNKLTLIEERQQNSAHAQSSLIETVQMLATRIQSLEQEAANSKRIASWIDRGVLGALGLMGLAIISKSGIV